MSRSIRARGFTLIESIMVITIIGLVAGIAIPRSGYSTYLANSGARVLATTLAYAQREAISQQSDIRVAFDVANNQIRVHEDRNNDNVIDINERVGFTSLPEGVVFGRGVAAPRALGAGPITFTETQGLLPVLESGRSVREGLLTAVETVTTLDHEYWQGLAAPDAAERMAAGTLRPDWRKRGFLRGYTDHRYTFGRYFAPLEPNRPRTVERLLADNDVVLYDRETDPHEQVNLAADPSHRELVSELSTKLESLIDAEIGSDSRAWVPERPRLVGWPTWRGDAA